MKRWVKNTTLVLGALGWGLAAYAGPEPAVGPGKWQLDFDFVDPQRISVMLPGAQQPTTYWYLLYTVTNNTGGDVGFYPSFQLVTDSIQVVEAGANIPPRVYDAIKARHEQEYPFLAPPRDVTGPLLQGSGNARTSVAVFETFDPEANAFTIYGSGLSGEVARVTNPAFDPSKPESEANARFFVLRKTLGITYALPGDAETRWHAKPVRQKREWVMR